MSSTQIPFTDDGKRTIASAATWGLIVSATSLVTGILTLLVELTSRTGESVLAQMVQTGFTVVVNIWLLQASLVLRNIASTTNTNDQGNLLIGFRKLRAYFMAQVFVVLIGIGIGVFGFLSFTLQKGSHRW